MTIQESIRRLAASRAEIYCKVCKVDAIDEGARTVDVSPLDESAPILGVNLQADQSAEVGVVAFPKQGSHVVVAFLADAAAVVVLASEVDKVHVKLGENDPLELSAADGKVSLNVGKTSLEIAKDKAITLNGGDNGGLTITPELKSQLEKMTARIDGIIDAIKNGVPAAQDGGTALKTSIVTALETIVQKEDFSKIEDKNIKH